jgi:ABC-type methionine transport system ATPase subunit
MGLSIPFIRNLKTDSCIQNVIVTNVYEHYYSSIDMIHGNIQIMTEGFSGNIFMEVANAEQGRQTDKEVTHDDAFQLFVSESIL